jgi:hypothetical protein
MHSHSLLLPLGAFLVGVLRLGVGKVPVCNRRWPLRNASVVGPRAAPVQRRRRRLRRYAGPAKSRAAKSPGMRRGAAHSAPMQGRLRRVAPAITRSYRRFPIFASDIAAVHARRFLSDKRPRHHRAGHILGLTQRDTATQAGMVGTHDLADGATWPSSCLA